MSTQRAIPATTVGAVQLRQQAADAPTSKVQLKAALRGQDLDTQVQMLSPGGGGPKSASSGKKPPAKGGGTKKSTAKTPSKPAQGEAPVDESDPKQLLLDQMAREWRAGEMEEYEYLKAHYVKLYGPVPGDESSGASSEADEEKAQMEQLLGTYWRNGEMEDFEALKEVYEKTYGAY